MHRSLFLLLATTATTTLAQIPTNLPFKSLVQTYLPFISLNTIYALNDTTTSAQLANAPDKPVTIFLTLNTPFSQFLATPPPSPAAGALEAASAANATLNSDLLQFLQIDGLHPSSSFNGTSFMETRLTKAPFDRMLAGNRIEVFRNETEFWIGTGIGFRSNVLIPDLEFAGGIVHIVDHPCAPPYTLADTGTILNLTIIADILRQPSLDINDYDTLTVFAVQNSAVHQLVPSLESENSTSLADTLAGYVVLGGAFYSTNLTQGGTVDGTLLPVGTNTSLEESYGGNEGRGESVLDVQVVEGEIYVNGSRILQRDVLVRNGVVHVIEAPFWPML